MDKHLEPLIRHYIKLDYDVSLEGSKAMLIYSNLALDYIEEEIHEGSHGPLPVSFSQESFKVPGRFGKSTLFFKESNSAHCKYDFILLTDLSMFKTSKAGKDLLKQKVLPYYDKHVKPIEYKKKLKKGRLTDYVQSHMTSASDVNLLRALDLDRWTGPHAEEEYIDLWIGFPTNEKYTNLLVKRLYENKFIPKHTSKMPVIKNKLQTQHDIYLHGSYAYDAFERIIQELKEDEK